MASPRVDHNQQAAERITPESDEALLGRLIVCDGHGSIIVEDCCGIREVDPMLASIQCRFARVPLELH